MLHGTAASEGIGIGKVMLIEEHSLEYTPRTVTDTEAESQRFKTAVDAFCYNTEKQAENLRSSAGEKEAEILAGHIQIIRDPYLSGEIEKLIADGQCAESALEHMCDMFIAMFSAADDELTKQRAADVRDIKSGVLGILLGVNEIKVSDAPKGTVLVARELTPSVTAGIVKENIAGIITETGGTTSHSAILARALEIPAVLSVEGVASSLKNGDTVVVDGSEGAVIVNPDDNTVAEYSKKRDAFLAERKELENYRGRETKSASGEVYELFCNIGKPEDAVKAVDADGEGVGLFRTEFLFMDRTSIPTEDEQYEAYKKAALILKGKSLIIRTLDIGGDKDIPYLGLKKEENPFMGFRAIRYCLKNRELFKSQIKAILRASAFGDIKIMFPLITTMDELREGKKLVAECKADLRNMGINFNENIQVGVMVETASAAVIADMLAKEADFFSIGTNDLTGYTMACDRGNNDVSYLSYSPLQPSVLRMIKRTIECGVQNGISVGMCGEAAANKLMIPLLISFGLTEFSVSAPSVLNVRKIISTWTKEEADKVTAKVLEMSTQQEIVEYLKSVV
ncbi:phosphoenolpyruvate--protein phosphotransferase [Ruminococcus bromii]|uniref:Phosphoenolpyruvate-protein phosphotransferase n=1 Tax=Ruminococcus bromii TaxID=40518 RepID=A0A2N0UW78_9FIRM|nr:phosphoenolpyruvate--protein phosphotransferase [Ruminococcus bromii]PKD31241.1 Phosphoenolpyruvate-protein phosphotransferase [Ruminococcus bromii]